IVAAENAFDTAQIGTGVNADALGFGHHAAIAGIPCIISQFKFGTNRPGGDDFVIAPIGGDVKFLTVPNTEPAVAASFTDFVIILRHAVRVINAGAIHLIDDEIARAFDPDVHAAAGERLFLPRF